MRCPCCGSGPVQIRGNRWECGWCGDSGILTQRTTQNPTQNTSQITLTLSFVYRVDLPETWSSLKKVLGQIAPKDTSLSQLLGKVLLHHISAGIQHAGALPDEKKAEELRTFLHNTADLNLGESAEEIMRDAKHGVLFCEEAALSKTECGTFWTELLSTRPVEDYYNLVDPDGLFELLSELSSAYAYFGGKKDEEMGEAQDYQNALKEAYNIHWQNKVLLHPDLKRAKRLLAEGSFPRGEDICREILLVEYPEEVPHETAEDFDELSWSRILDEVFADDPEKGMEMWRRLLDIAEPSLKTDAKTAEKLLPDWDWPESPTDDQALPLLVALDDERFASQLFESASIGRLQLKVLNACRSCGQEDLGQHCLELALQNPYLEENWEKRLRRVFTTVPSSGRSKPRPYPAKPIADTKPDDGTVYHYCSVQVQGARRPYAYLTGGLPLKVGDWVELPFGKDDVLRRGQVKAVMDCTRMAAPLASGAIAVSKYDEQRSAAYDAALQELSNGNYVSAEQDFSALSGYRDVAKREQSRKDKYSGKLPVDGMPVSCLKYTSIGSPTKTEKCQFYDSMDVHRRYKILHWYNSEGQTVASCQSHQPKGAYTEVIYAFTYYEMPIGRPNSAPAWTPPSTSGGSNSGSVRDDYDNPEDLWEDNQDWYEDEDEAWDEWENS